MKEGVDKLAPLLLHHQNSHLHTDIISNAPAGKSYYEQMQCFCMYFITP